MSIFFFHYYYFPEVRNANRNKGLSKEPFPEEVTDIEAVWRMEEPFTIDCVSLGSDSIISDQNETSIKKVI